MLAIAIAPRLHFIFFTKRRKPSQDSAKKPAQPNAFAFAPDANSVHAVIPITRTHQRQSVLAQIETAIDGPRAMLEHRRTLSRDLGLHIVFHLIGLEQRTLEKWHHFVQHRMVPG